MNHDNIIKALFQVSEGYRMLGVALGNISPELLQGSAPTAEPEPAPTAEPEPGGPPHSCLKASIGLSRAARCAGRYPNTTPTKKENPKLTATETHVTSRFH